MTIKDSEGGTLYVCEGYSTMGTMFGDEPIRSLYKDEALLCEYDRTRPYWKMKHWAYAGMYTHFFIGNSIFHLSLELLTKFWKTSCLVL